MAVNVSAQYDGGLLPDTVLLTLPGMLLPSGNPFKRHKNVLSLQPMISPKSFNIFFLVTAGCSEGLDAFRFFFKEYRFHDIMPLRNPVISHEDLFLPLQTIFLP